MLQRFIIAACLSLTVTTGAFSTYGFQSNGQPLAKSANTSDIHLQTQSAPPSDTQTRPQSKQSIDIALFQPIADSIQSFLDGIDIAVIKEKIKVENVLIYPKKAMEIHFTRTLSEYPMRDNIVSTIYGIAVKLMPVDFAQYSLKIYSSNTLLEELSSSYFSGRRPALTGQIPDREANWVTNTSLPYEITRGLQDRHIALWQSHGYYYEKKESRWEWQRARYFQTVEDLYTQSYVLPYLVPMLENAGAYVMMPRERDFNTTEIIVDNSDDLYTERNANGATSSSNNATGNHSSSSGSHTGKLSSSSIITTGNHSSSSSSTASTVKSSTLSDEMWSQATGAGFANSKAIYLYGENPFAMGTSREILQVKSSRNKSGSTSVASWCPYFTQSGRYAVYVTYKSSASSTSAAEYVVRHAGGETSFKVNQKIGGSTWVYLGTFNFASVENSAEGNFDNEGSSTRGNFTGRVTSRNGSSNKTASNSKSDASRNIAAQGVYLYNSNPEGHKFVKGAVVSADAVKFGGGMGNIARGVPTQVEPDLSTSVLSASSNSSISDSSSTLFGTDGQAYVSGYPRYSEAARYWLQWAGFPTEVYSPENDTDDYRDDYRCRGIWVNHLLSQMNIPVDLSLAFHSDAGVTPTDSIVGTLAIFTRISEGKDKFASGGDRLASRELADMVQTQIVNDIRATFEPDWSRRGLWDRSYFECRVPEVPAMLLELLSHQNFADMRYGQDPNFKFTVCRAVYKGMLRFLSEYYGFKYVVQPLPVKDFATSLVESGGKPSVKLSWSPVEDPLEPTATPREYIVYTRAIPLEAFAAPSAEAFGQSAPYEQSASSSNNGNGSQTESSSITKNGSLSASSSLNGNGSMTASQVTDSYGFDAGRLVSKSTSVTLPIEPGYVYSYKVVPVNDGGAGFPSEILSAGLCQDWRNKYTVLIVNGFDRISAPESFATADTLIAGFADNMDSGVGYINNYAYTGSQFEFRRALDWADDDAPGFGASNANYERAVVAGNSFDYPLSHGIGFLNAGYNFVSSSSSAICAAQVTSSSDNFSTNTSQRSSQSTSPKTRTNSTATATATATSSALSLGNYPIVDLILGKQRTCSIGRPGAKEPRFEAFPIELQSAISKYCHEGGNIIVSGSYIASDIWQPTSLPTANFQPNAAPKNTHDEEMKEAHANIEALNSLLYSMQSDIYRKVTEAKRLNDSLGFEYYKIDPQAIENLQNTVTSIKQKIEALSADVAQSSKDIKAIEQGTDASERSKAFASEILKYKYLTGHASVTGQVNPTRIFSDIISANSYATIASPSVEPANSYTTSTSAATISANSSATVTSETTSDNSRAGLHTLTFHTRPNPYNYSVESPDGITPTDPDAKVILRYAENNIPAGIAYTSDQYRTIALGFPIESLTTQQQINQLLSTLLSILTSSVGHPRPNHGVSTTKPTSTSEQPALATKGHSTNETSCRGKINPSAGPSK